MPLYALSQLKIVKKKKSKAFFRIVWRENVNLAARENDAYISSPPLQEEQTK